MELLTLLYGTVLLRPYVFIFLAFYLPIAIIHMGPVRSFLFTGIAYSIAFLSEYSSTRNGFPYGMYTYIETTRGQELWIANVPFMDSLSFTFLSYISYTMSLFLWLPLKKEGWNTQIVESKTLQSSWKVVFTGALLFMLMDVVIDPVAFRGDRWFLGKIYTYAEEGDYFNIPLTNFAGWFVVGTAILGAFTRTEPLITRYWRLKDWGPFEVSGKAFFGPALYFGVLAFNLAVTFYIEEYILGFCGIFLTAAISILLIYKIKHSS